MENSCAISSLIIVPFERDAQNFHKFFFESIKKDNLWLPIINVPQSLVQISESAPLSELLDAYTRSPLGLYSTESFIEIDFTFCRDKGNDRQLTLNPQAQITFSVHLEENSSGIAGEFNGMTESDSKQSGSSHGSIDTEISFREASAPPSSGST